MKNVGDDYSLGGMIVVTILGIIGVIMIMTTGILDIRTFDDFIEYANEFIIVVMFAGLFIGVTILVYVSYFRNRILKPKEKVVYLLERDEKTCTFINEKGKLFFYNDRKLEAERYYNVLMTKDYIHEIKGTAIEAFDIPKAKESYWLNFYSPVGNFENLFLLPILYVIAIPGVFSTFFAEGFGKVMAAIYSIAPLLLIIYDLIYKIKKNKGENPEETYEKEMIKAFEMTMNVFKKIILIGAVLLVECVIIWLFVCTKDTAGRIIISPFLICVTCMFIGTIASVLGKEDIKNVMIRVYGIVFMLFWFIALIFAVYIYIKEKTYGMVLFTIPFWIAGIFLAIKVLKKE